MNRYERTHKCGVALFSDGFGDHCFTCIIINFHQRIMREKIVQMCENVSMQRKLSDTDEQKFDEWRNKPVPGGP